MREKISENIERGRYICEIPLNSAFGWQNKNGGWIDYLISERIIFSHRINDYDTATFPEQLNAHGYYELSVCRDAGELQYIADGQYTSIPSGSAVLTKLDAMHMFRILEPTHYDRFVIYFKDIDGLFPERSVLDFLTKGNAHNAVFIPHGDLYPSLAGGIEDALSDRASPYSAARALLSLTELFIALSESSSDSEDILSAQPPAFIGEVKEYIDREYTNIRSVTKLAEHFFYSREYLTREFRRYYNTPIYEYILRRKILHSCSLLREGATVEHAASESGFTNMSSFIKIFKKQRGTTPSEYKMSQ